MSQMLLRQAVNSSHPGEMPSSLRSQVGQIASWGSGGGPSGGEEERIKTKESERKRQKGQGAEAAFRERRRATQELRHTSQAAYIKVCTLWMRESALPCLSACTCDIFGLEGPPQTHTWP